MIDLRKQVETLVKGGPGSGRKKGFRPNSFQLGTMNRIRSLHRDIRASLPLGEKPQEGDLETMNHLANAHNAIMGGDNQAAGEHMGRAVAAHEKTHGFKAGVRYDELRSIHSSLK